MMGKLIAWFEAEGSTRPAALLRIGLVFLIWVRFADEVALYASQSWIAVYFGAMFFLVTAMMLVGVRTRLATIMTALMLAGIYFVAGYGEKIEGWQSHHIYLMLAVTILLAMGPCGASFSIDRLQAVNAAEREGRAPPPERARLISMRLIAIQVAALYFWTAFDKSTLAWLTGERLQRVFWWVYDGQPLFDLLTTQPIPMVMSIAVLVVEYLLVPGILIRRFQPIAIPTAIAMHALFYIFLPVKTYSSTVILLYLAIIDADTTNRFIERMMGRVPIAGSG